MFEHFDVFVNGSEVKNGKPNPEIFLLAAERLKLDASKCIVVEDAIFGCVAGRKASCKVIACVEKKFEKKLIYILPNPANAYTFEHLSDKGNMAEFTSILQPF